jgi:hypothetical protein
MYFLTNSNQLNRFNEAVDEQDHSLRLRRENKNIVAYYTPNGNTVLLVSALTGELLVKLRAKGFGFVVVENKDDRFPAKNAQIEVDFIEPIRYIYEPQAEYENESPLDEHDGVQISTPLDIEEEDHLTLDQKQQMLTPIQYLSNHVFFLTDNDQLNRFTRAVVEQDHSIRLRRENKNIVAYYQPNGNSVLLLSALTGELLVKLRARGFRFVVAENNDGRFPPKNAEIEAKKFFLDFIEPIRYEYETKEGYENLSAIAEEDHLSPSENAAIPRQILLLSDDLVFLTNDDQLQRFVAAVNEGDSSVRQEGKDVILLYEPQHPDIVYLVSALTGIVKAKLRALPNTLKFLVEGRSGDSRFPPILTRISRVKLFDDYLEHIRYQIPN